MAIALEQSWDGKTAGGTSVSVTVSGVTSGNALIAVVTIDGQDPTATQPIGFSLIQQTGAEGINTESWIKIADGTEGTLTFTGDSEEYVLNVTEWSGTEYPAITQYTGESYDISGNEPTPISVSWNSDGTKFFILGVTNDTVYEYTVSVGFDLSSTVAYSGNSFSIASQETTSAGMVWNSDGTKFFVVGGNNTVYEYSVSTGFDLGSTVAYSNNSFLVSSQETLTKGISWNSDGTKFFIIGATNDTVYEYTVSVGFDLSSTVAYSNNSFSVLAQSGDSRTVLWNLDGTKFFVLGATNTRIYEYTVSVGFDLSSTVAYSNNSYDISSQETLPKSMAWNSDGTKFFILGVNTGTVYEYSLSVAYDLTNSLTINSGVSTAPLSLSITPKVADSLVLVGFGVDGDSTPHTLDASLTSIVEPQLDTDDGQSSGANGSAGQSIGYEIHAASATGDYTHTLASSDGWIAWTLAILPAGSASTTQGTATFASIGALASDGFASYYPTAPLTGSGTFSAIGTTNYPSTAPFTASGSLDSTGVLKTIYLSTAAFSSSGSLSATGVIVNKAVGTFTGAGSFLATGTSTVCPTVTLVTDVSSGTLDLATDGSFTYDYSGSGPYPDTDFFEYKIEDINGISNTARVDITITDSAITFQASWIKNTTLIGGY